MWQYGRLNDQTVFSTPTFTTQVSSPVRYVVGSLAPGQYWSQLIASSGSQSSTDPPTRGSRTGDLGVAPFDMLPTPLSRPNRRFYTGFTHGPVYPHVAPDFWAQVDKLRSPGLGVYRINLNYGIVNGDNKPWHGPPNWDTVENAATINEYNEALAHSNAILITLSQGTPGNDIWPDEDSMRQFASAVAGKFPRAQYFEIGNEPNGPVHGPRGSRKGISAIQYVALVRAALPVLKAAGREVLVGSINGDNAPIDAMSFLGALFDPNTGLTQSEKDQLYALSVHPYPKKRNCGQPGSSDVPPKAKILPTIEGLGWFLSEARKRNYWSGRVWLTEFDWNRTAPWDTPNKCQAKDLARVINILFDYLNGCPDDRPPRGFCVDLERVEALIWYGFSETTEDDWFGGLVPRPNEEGYDFRAGTAGRSASTNPYLAWLSNVR
jgi:hypothetical protein